MLNFFLEKVMDSPLSSPSRRTPGVSPDMLESAKLTDLCPSLSPRSLLMDPTQLKSAKKWLKESTQLSSRHLPTITSSSRVCSLSPIWSPKELSTPSRPLLRRLPLEPPQLLAELSFPLSPESLSSQEVSLRRRLPSTWTLWIDYKESLDLGLLPSHTEEPFKIPVLRPGLVYK